MAQKGMFTVHGDDLTTIEKLCPNAVEKFVISYNLDSRKYVTRNARNTDKYMLFAKIMFSLCVHS